MTAQIIKFPRTYRRAESIRRWNIVGKVRCKAEIIPIFSNDEETMLAQIALLLEEIKAFPVLVGNVDRPIRGDQGWYFEEV